MNLTNKFQFELCLVFRDFGDEEKTVVCELLGIQIFTLYNLGKKSIFCLDSQGERRESASATLRGCALALV